jgi:uncharacterized lipoprotein YajG
VRLAKHLVVTMAAILLTGCGSPSYQDSLKASVAGMRDAITSYNGSASVDVHSSGSDCATARDALQNTPRRAAQDLNPRANCPRRYGKRTAPR